MVGHVENTAFSSSVSIDIYDRANVEIVNASYASCGVSNGRSMIPTKGTFLRPQMTVMDCQNLPSGRRIGSEKMLLPYLRKCSVGLKYRIEK